MSGKAAPSTAGADFEDFVVKVSSNNNATQLLSSAQKASGTGGFQAQQCSGVGVAVNAGDTIEVWARSGDTANRTIRGVSAWSFLEVSEGLVR